MIPVDLVDWIYLIPKLYQFYCSRAVLFESDTPSKGTDELAPTKALQIYPGLSIPRETPAPAALLAAIHHRNGVRTVVGISTAIMVVCASRKGFFCRYAVF
jgi:hypothetical protein